ncbi:MAG: HAD-IA family hydrolase [Lentisphaeria bacterium]|nr:HAD-IA family hydrolase [Lentisphaeria bacterium]
MAAVMLAAVDIGNVCIQLQVEKSNRAFGYSGELPVAFTTLTEQYETGKIGTVEFLKKMSAVTGLSEAAAKLAWELKLGSEMPGMADAIRDFAAKGVEFVFLSDIGELHLTAVRRNVSFVNFFKGGIFSFEAGVCKPDHRIFRTFEDTYGKPAVFFDDLEKNIKSASEFGWNAVQFTGADMFRETMNQLLSGNH